MWEKEKEDVDMDDKASVANSAVGGASVAASAFGGSVAATQGTTVVGSIATESVAASDLGVDQMLVDESSTKDVVPGAEEAQAAEKKEGDNEKKPEPEPNEEILNNP